MKLMSVEELRQKLNERDLADVKTLLGTALDLVTPHLSTLLGTPFSYKAAQKDYFLADPRIPSATKHMTSLRLSRGFLDPEVEVKVFMAFNVDDLPISPLLDEVIVNRERGLIQVLAPVDVPRYYLVEYASGLKVGEQIPDGEDLRTVYQDVPDWLKEACLLHARTLLASMKDSQNKESKKKKPVDDPTSRLIMQMLTPYIRWCPTAFQPVIS